MERSDRITVVQLVGQMLISDGELGDGEHEYLERVIAMLALSDEERKEALGGINVDSPVEERVASLAADARERLVSELETAMHADGTVTPGEQRMLDKVKAVLRS